jgi:hypothetical protein
MIRIRQQLKIVTRLSIGLAEKLRTVFSITSEVLNIALAISVFFQKIYQAMT